MREIKFRMYDTNMKEYVKKIHDNYTWWNNGELMCIQEPLILEQYTGLKDKNGVEIYEGDIVQTSINFRGSPLAHAGEIVWDEIHSFWATSNDAGLTACFKHYGDREIISHIHEDSK